MTQIKISIDCDGVYCQSCCHVEWDDGMYCRVFKSNLLPVYLDGSTQKFKRCPQCIAATVEE